MTDPARSSLKPANGNPWYCLATVHGEQGLGRDDDLATKNVMAWNHWFSDITGQQRDEIAQAYAARRGKVGLPPAPNETIDFSDTYFKQPVDFRRFLFVQRTDFVGAQFAGAVSFQDANFQAAVTFHNAEFSDVASFRSAQLGKTNFRSAKFCGTTTFRNATFRDFADFQSATFADIATFHSAKFLAAATFKSAKFDDFANFHAVEFSGTADFASAAFIMVANFRSVTFSNGALFHSSRFDDDLDFINATFEAMTSFAGAGFVNQVPDFRGATMHEATEWHGTIWPEPQEGEKAQKQVYTYERLKQEMERLKKHEDEQTFFRKELRARRGLFPVYSGARLLNFIYQATSDYGNSIVRPLVGLLCVFVVGIAIFMRSPAAASHCSSSMSLELATRISFANIFVLLPDKREIMTPELLSCWSTTARIVSGLQSLTGVVLLFLLGLALRNRFRMK